MNAPDTLAVYVHWPFCVSKCPYCDFNSHVRAHTDQKSWADAYVRELDFVAEQVPNRRVTSIFFGGGTPSLMQPDVISQILKAIGVHWTLDPQVEVTLEANPTSIEAEKFKAFSDTGINRVSVGVQALREDALKFLGRKHSVAESLKALEIAQKFFKRFSFDLIYARPEQTLDDWRTELTEALSLGADHLSLYQLTIEPQTEFYTAHARGAFTMPDEALAADFYALTGDITTNAGLHAYEVSNYARVGQESRHNLSYWQCGDYVGIGPGAHGRLTVGGSRFATRTHRAPEIWQARVHAHGHGYHPFEMLTPAQQASEVMVMGLRLAAGVPLMRLEAASGTAWQNVIDTQRLQVAQKEELVRCDGTHLVATPAGRLQLNRLMAYLMR